MNRVLVLGGSGFLGRHIVDAVGAAGIEVVVAGRTRRANTVHVDLQRDSMRSVAGVIAPLRPDVVVNCVGRTTGTTRQLIDANALVPSRVAEAVARAAPGARVIHLGSAAEYGAPEIGRLLDENAAEEPVSPYGISKLAGTRLLLAAATDSDLDVVILRVFNPIGPGAPESSLPGRAAGLIRQALASNPVGEVQLAGLDAFRDWVDVRDLGAAVLAAVRAEALESRLFNIGSGRAVRSRNVVSALAAAAGYRTPVREDPDAAPVRSSGVAWTQADISRAARELRWRPVWDLDDSIKELWRSEQWCPAG